MSAYAYETGATSIGVRVTVESCDPREDEPSPTTAACFTTVAVDEAGDPTEVPPVVPETDPRRDGSVLTADAVVEGSRRPGLDPLAAGVDARTGIFPTILVTSRSVGY